MTDQYQYLHHRVRMGWAMLAAGLFLLIAGIALQLLVTVSFNPRIVSGLGILFIGLGLAQIVRYRAAQGDPKAAKRLVNEERDERSRMIRAQAGSRAFVVSLGLTYIALMWLSLAGNGSLPAPSLDALWFYLVGASVAPIAVYVIGIVNGEKNN